MPNMIITKANTKENLEEFICLSIMKATAKKSPVFLCKIVSVRMVFWAVLARPTICPLQYYVRGAKGQQSKDRALLDPRSPLPRSLRGIELPTEELLGDPNGQKWSSSCQNGPKLASLVHFALVECVWKKVVWTKLIVSQNDCLEHFGPVHFRLYCRHSLYSVYIIFFYLTEDDSHHLSGCPQRDAVRGSMAIPSLRVRWPGIGWSLQNSGQIKLKMGTKSCKNLHLPNGQISIFRSFLSVFSSWLPFPYYSRPPESQSCHESGHS